MIILIHSSTNSRIEFFGISKIFGIYWRVFTVSIKLGGVGWGIIWGVRNLLSKKSFWVWMIILIDSTTNTSIKFLWICEIFYPDWAIFTVSIKLSGVSWGIIWGVWNLLSKKSSWIWMRILIDSTTNSSVELFRISEVFNPDWGILSIAIELCWVSWGIVWRVWNFLSKKSSRVWMVVLIHSSTNSGIEFLRISKIFSIYRRVFTISIKLGWVCWSDIWRVRDLFDLDGWNIANQSQGGDW